MSPNETGPIVVGIDGSPAALRAAEWAVTEAIGRDVPIRLVHVVQSTSIDIHRERSAGESALREAREAINHGAQPVKVEEVIAYGPVAATLAAECAGSTMICLGSKGLGTAAAKYVGSTTTAVAQSVECAVAIVRSAHAASSPESQPVAAVVDDAHDVERVLTAALHEARLRSAPLKILNVVPSRIRDLFPEDVDRRIAEYLADCPDVHADVVLAPGDVTTFLAASQPPVQLAVAARSTGDGVTELVGPYARMMLKSTTCSVLLLAS
jgi:nucleotide-binding universal stress UspA family protein